MPKMVPLTRGHFAIVDNSDYDLVSQHNWHSSPGKYTAYALTKIYNDEGKRISLRMHRLIIDAPKGIEVDHINRNGLDNRKCNLRLVDRRTQVLNSGLPSDNKSGYKGVIQTPSGKWVAYHTIVYQKHHLGTYDTPKQAVQVRDRFIRSLHND